MSAHLPIASELWQRWNLPCSGPLCGCIQPKEAVQDRFRSGSSRSGADDCSVACQHHSGQGPNPKDGPRRRCSARAGPRRPRPSPAERLRRHHRRRPRRRHRRPTAKLPHGDHHGRTGRWSHNHAQRAPLRLSGARQEIIIVRAWPPSTTRNRRRRGGRGGRAMLGN
jgi:hypothetical protein